MRRAVSRRLAREGGILSGGLEVVEVVLLMMPLPSGTASFLVLFYSFYRSLQLCKVFPLPAP